MKKPIILPTERKCCNVLSCDGKGSLGDTFSQGSLICLLAMDIGHYVALSPIFLLSLASRVSIYSTHTLLRLIFDGIRHSYSVIVVSTSKDTLHRILLPEHLML